MTPLLMLPGIGDSAADHWQSIWQHDHPSAARLQPASWDEPQLDDWLSALDRMAQSATDQPVLVAHSLGCLLVAHWAARGGRAEGAFLVGTPDPEGAEFPAAAASFVDVPDEALTFPLVVVASSDDPYAESSFSRSIANSWGGTLIDIGARGHINAETVGAWPEGRSLLAAFCAGLDR